MCHQSYFRPYLSEEPFHETGIPGTVYPCDSVVLNSSVTHFAQKYQLCGASDILDYIDKIINYLMELIKNNYIDNSSSKCKNVQIFTLLNNTFKYDINIEEKAKMLVNGYNEGRFFIKNIDSDIYTKKTINKMYKYP